MEITVKLNKNQLWVLQRRFGKRYGEKRLVAMAIAEVVKREVDQMMAEAAAEIQAPEKEVSANKKRVLETYPDL